MSDAYLRSLYQPRTGQGIRGHRRWYFCDSTVAEHGPDDLIRTCAGCGHFYTRCCPHEKKLRRDGHDSESSDSVCHNYSVVYTDGACLNNGRRDSIQYCGLGVAMGTDKNDQLSVSVDEKIDSTGIRTNQRAELLAAIEGLRLWADVFACGGFPESLPHTEGKRAVIITTDSEYVVKGMTEWYPTWQAKGWRAADGKPPKNLDLFHKLEDQAKHVEWNFEVDVGFLHVLREYNTVADSLATESARAASSV